MSNQKNIQIHTPVFSVPQDYSVASFLNSSQNPAEAWKKARGLRDKAELPESLLSPRAESSALAVGFREDCLNIA